MPYIRSNVDSVSFGNKADVANSTVKRPLNFIKSAFVGLKNKVKTLFNLEPEITKEEYEQNARFIAKIQRKIPRIYPFGEFDISKTRRLSIKPISKGYTRFDLYDISQAEPFHLRSLTTDKNNVILKYNTSYPWKEFKKNDKGYICKDNQDEYIKDLFAGYEVYLKLFNDIM